MTPENYLTDIERAKLAHTEKDLYEYAMNHIGDSWARGPYGGWARAHDALKKLGWTEVKKEEGCRVFVSLSRPEKVELQEAGK